MAGDEQALTAALEACSNPSSGSFCTQSSSDRTAEARESEESLDRPEQALQLTRLFFQGSLCQKSAVLQVQKSAVVASFAAVVWRRKKAELVGT